MKARGGCLGLLAPQRLTCTIKESSAPQQLHYYRSRGQQGPFSISCQAWKVMVPAVYATLKAAEG